MTSATVNPGSTGSIPVAATGDPIVSLRSIGRTFANGTVALDGLSFDIAPGSFVSLLGPSGCGKSTALRIIAGLGQPTAGSVQWSAPEDQREIGYVFQEPTLMPWSTVFGNVFLPLRLRGVSRNAARAPVLSALRMVGLEDVANSYPRELSGGMRMRVSIARALVTGPRLLLMDEPFAALDEINRFRLNKDLLALWQEHRFTVIFVTHSVFESVFLSERILVMTARPGRVAADIAIDASYPRTDQFRTSAAYAEHCRTVSNALELAMSAGAT